MEIAVDCYRSLVELVGLVIEKTEAAYLKSFPCVVVKKTFQITCGIASFQIQKIKLILFFRVPASSRRLKMILQFSYNLAPVSKLLATLCKITRPVRLRPRLEIGQ